MRPLGQIGKDQRAQLIDATLFQRSTTNNFLKLKSLGRLCHHRQNLIALSKQVGFVYHCDHRALGPLNVLKDKIIFLGPTVGLEKKERKIDISQYRGCCSHHIAIYRPSPCGGMNTRRINVNRLGQIGGIDAKQIVACGLGLTRRDGNFLPQQMIH